MRTELRLAGFGGQGILLAGIVIGKAASLFDNKYAVQTQSYGPEARGGASKCDVVISNEEIDYPKLTKADILVAMSHEALIKYLDTLKPEGTLILDPDLVFEEEIEDFVKQNNIKTYRAPATKTADSLGLRIVANIVMTGAITKATEIISKESAIKSIENSVPKGTESKNIQAFEAGYNLI